LKPSLTTPPPPPCPPPHTHTHTQEADYSDIVVEKLKAIELELYMQSAYIAADATKRASRKAAEKVAELTGTEVDDHLPKKRGVLSAVAAALSRSSTPTRRTPS